MSANELRSKFSIRITTRVVHVPAEDNIVDLRLLTQTSLSEFPLGGIARLQASMTFEHLREVFSRVHAGAI